MENIVKHILSKISKTPKNIASQVDQYVGKKISERYENIKIEKRQQVKFFTGLIVLICLLIILLVPMTYIFTKVKVEVVEHSIKSPNEILLELDSRISENYPEINMLTGAYIPENQTENRGYFWQFNQDIRTIKYSNEEWILEKENATDISSVNFLNLQYDGSKKEKIQIYSPNMEVFCMLANPALYQDSHYIKANPYITLHIGQSLSTWEIFSFYKCKDISNLLQKQENKTDLYAHLVKNSDYIPESIEPVAEFKSNLFFILATDTTEDISYIIGTKMVV